jgi:hypothetical protein
MPFRILARCPSIIDQKLPTTFFIYSNPRYHAFFFLYIYKKSICGPKAFTISSGSLFSFSFFFFLASESFHSKYHIYVYILFMRGMILF